MVGEPASAAEPVRLHCLGGATPPPELAADLELLASFPSEAQQKIWQVITPSLAEPIAAATGELLDVFCAAYHIEDAALARALKACRFLIREGARLDTPAAAFAADLQALCPRTALVQELLLAGYEQVKKQLRWESALATLADHGKLVTGVRFRVDQVQSSERAESLRVPVTMLTLYYRKGGETGRVTLQVLADELRALRAACDKALG